MPRPRAGFPKHRGRIPRKRSRRDEDDDDVSEQEVKSSNKANKKAKTNDSDEGQDSFWELGNKRRATISGYHGQTLINIREYYMNAHTDQLMPGKKGISLTPEQYIKLVETIPSINAELRDKGFDVPDVSVAPVPKSKPKSNPDKVKNEEEDEDEAEGNDQDEEEDELAPVSPAKSNKAKKAKAQPKKEKKANIEATSDEEGES
ncbi:transcriptional Coactivator p15-domain-containing protein, partial [Hypoxylon rubiginosum]